MYNNKIKINYYKNNKNKKILFKIKLLTTKEKISLLILILNYKISFHE